MKTLAVLALALLGTAGSFLAHKKAPPLVVLNPMPTGEIGVYYDQPVFTGGKPPYRCSITGALPPGLYLNQLICHVQGIPK